MNLLFSFNGRINRAKWWLGIVLIIVLAVVIGGIVGVLAGVTGNMRVIENTAMLTLVFTVLLAYPSTAMMVKRIHDRDRPTWLVAVFWIPTILGTIGDVAGITKTKMDIGGQMVDIPTPIGWVIVVLTVVIGIWALIELGILKGTDGPNQHGPDPLA